MDQAKANSNRVDIGTSRVARVYAEALLRAAQQQGIEDTILEEYDSIVHDLLDQDSRLEPLLSMAAVGRKAREEIIRKTFAPRAHPILSNFLFVLNQHER